MARQAFTFDGIIEVQSNHACALVFEQIWQEIHISTASADEIFIEDGKAWLHFTYFQVYSMFDVTRPDGEIVNLMGSQRTTRRAIDHLVSIELLCRKRHQVGIALAINFDTLLKLVGDGISRYWGDDPF